MTKVNYINQWNAAIEILIAGAFNPVDLSLYMILFAEWNHKHFEKCIEINRSQVMERAKINSPTTYYKCIKKLERHGLIRYYPSRDPKQGSKIQMKVLQTSEDENQNRSLQSFFLAFLKQKDGQQKIEVINAFKRELASFFEAHGGSISMAQQFYNHYESIAWKKSGQTITDWKPLAKNWIIRSKEQARSKPKPEKNPLYVPRNKNYNEPL